MKKTLLICFAVIAFISCKNENPETSNVTPETENADVASIEDEDPLCKEIGDMIAAMPKIEKYGGYELTSTICNPNRTYGFIFEKKDSDLEFTIILRDTRNPDNADFIKMVQDGHSEASVTKDPKTLRTSSLIGQKAYVVGINNPEQMGGSFNGMVKDNYFLYALIANDASATNADAIEKFLKEYTSKINLSKLK